MSPDVVTGDFRTVAVLNRGEAAMRFMRGAETWSRKNRIELNTIALYTAADAEAPFVQAATRAVLLDAGATELKSPYLDIDYLLDTAEGAGADAIWPGWGFVAEEPDLARACHDRGLIFLGPPEAAISRMSDKVTAKTMAGTHGVSVAPWSEEPVANAEAALRQLESIGYPALLKSAAGGGGRGIRRVDGPDEVGPAFDAAAAEALATSGNPALFIERFVADARHVEVQVLADAHGHVWTLGTRDCSVQRNNQKLIEEAPAPALDDAIDEALQEAAHTLATACEYVGVGTAEFLLLPDESIFYFLEMNARLQVEHTVTEAIYGIDLIAFQIDVARGVDLNDLEPPTARGVAIEARLNAEDPDDHFAPRTGKLVRFSPPDGPWVRVDTGYVEGNEIPSDFDSNVAKIITWGVNRKDALARMQTALYDTSCGVETGLSNRSLLLELIRDSAYRKGPVRTKWLESYLPQRPPASARNYLPVALAAAAIGDHLRARREKLRLFFAEALTGLPRRVQSPGPRTLKYMVEGSLVDVEMGCLAPMTYVVRCGDWEAVIRARSAGSHAMILDVDGRRHSVIRVLSSEQLHIDVEGVAHRFEKVSDGNVTARIPAAVNQIHTAVNDRVQAGQRLITLEAMKMEFPVDAPIAGTIEAIHVGPSESIDAGDILVEIAPETDGNDGTEPPGIELPTHHRESLAISEILRANLLGYDVDEKLCQEALDALLDEAHCLPQEELFDLWSHYVSRECLFWKGPGDDATNDARESSADQLAWFLRRRRLDEEVLSARFVARLKHFLSLHDINTIRPGERLDNALVRLFQARANRDLGDAIATAALRAVLPRGRHRGASAPSSQFQAPFEWAGDDARTLLESFATRAADRRRWELAALTWHYVHALESHGDALSSDAAAQFQTSIPTWTGFKTLRLETDLSTAPGIQLRAFQVHATDVDDDRRLFVEVAVGPASRIDGDDGPRIPGLERAFLDAATVIRRHGCPDSDVPYQWNRIALRVDGDLDACRQTWMSVARRLAGQTLDLRLEAVVVSTTGELRSDEIDSPVHCVILDTATGLGPSVRLLSDPLPVRPLTDHQRGMLGAHRRGRFYPFEVVDWLTSGLGSQASSTGVVAWPDPPRGKFEEWDFVDGEFGPAHRPWGQNTAALVVGIIENDIGTHRDLKRVLIVGDSTKTMGSLGEAECRRVIAAIDLAEQRGLAVEWVPVSAGARIAFDSGTENLDWTARVLRRIIEFTQAGGPIHIVVDGPCVGAQSYWNAEATMLMHCKGALVMTGRGYMILTGRKALEYSGSIAAESNKALGGEEIMVPNGEAQYSATDLIDAYQLLFQHYRLTTTDAAGDTADPIDRDICKRRGRSDADYATLGELFDNQSNPGRKRPFAIRDVMAAVLDADCDPLERWRGIEGGESAVTWLGTLGAQPVTMIGIESQPVPRKGPHPVDGPDTWMSGTLFPQSSRKIARSINAASGVHPVVVLANLSGFDGSPESLRERQLEFGAQIARAVVNFEGPILFNVIARYHGGAFVVFSRALNDNIRVSALENTYASVIGGAPAAAVVFPRKVNRRLRKDPRFEAAQALDDPAQKRARIQAIRADIQSNLATEFDAIHDIERARSVGSLDDIVSPQRLRPYLIGQLP